MTGRTLSAVFGLPFVAAPYTQPPAVTLAQIAREGFDTTRMHASAWRGRRPWSARSRAIRPRHSSGWTATGAR